MCGFDRMTQFIGYGVARTADELHSGDVQGTTELVHNRYRQRCCQDVGDRLCCSDHRVAPVSLGYSFNPTEESMMLDRLLRNLREPKSQRFFKVLWDLGFSAEITGVFSRSLFGFSPCPSVLRGPFLPLRTRCPPGLWPPYCRPSLCTSQQDDPPKQYRLRLR